MSSKLSIRQRLWFSSLLLLAALAAILTFYVLPEIQKGELQNFKKSASAIITASSVNLGAGLYFRQPSFLHKVMVPLENNLDVSFIYIADTENERQYGFRDEDFRPQIKELNLSGSNQLSLNQLYLIKQNIFFNNRIQGKLIVGFSLKRLLSRGKYLRYRFFLAMAVLALFIVLLTVWISNSISKPLRTILNVIQNPNLRQADLDVEGETALFGEVALIGEALQQKARELNERLNDLRKSKQSMEALFRLSPIPILITDPLGQIEEANESAVSFFDLESEKLKECNLETFFEARDFENLFRKEGAGTAALSGYVTGIQTPSGKKKIAEINLSVVCDDFNTTKNYIIALIDITEKMQIQQEILQNQTQLHQMNRELVQKTAELETAVDKNKKNAKKLAKLIEISQEIVRCTDTQRVFDILLTDSRELLEAESCLLFLWDPDKKHLLPAKSFPDGIHRKIAPIKADKGVIGRTFFENQSYFLNSDSLIAADYEELGLEPNEDVFLIAVPISEKDYKFGVAAFLHRDKKQFYLEDLHLITTLSHQAAITLDKLYLLQALRNEAQRLEQAYADLKKSQQQVVQLQKMESLGTLVGGIAHDFNNILGIIIPNVDLILMRAHENQEISRRAVIIQEAASRAADLTRQLLMFSRNQDVKLEPISPNPLMMRLASMFRRTLGKHIEVVTELDPAIPYIKADETRLTQVLINLAVNSRDAMLKGGVLTLRSSVKLYAPDKTQGAKQRKYVCLSVSDTGEGIPTEHLSNIFDPFFTTKVMGKGTGLGLSVVYGIIKSHNGYIEVESEPGRGTTVNMYFEPAKEIPAKVASEEMEVYPAGHETILVIDDEEMIRESLSDILQSLGYEVLMADSGKEALRLLKEKKAVHLAIVDFAMPQMNGIETIKLIRGINPKIKILLSSGHADRDRIMEEKIPIDGFLAKPYHITDLARKIKSVLKNSIFSTN